MKLRANAASIITVSIRTALLILGVEIADDTPNDQTIGKFDSFELQSTRLVDGEGRIPPPDQKGPIPTDYTPPRYV